MRTDYELFNKRFKKLRKLLKRMGASDEVFVKLDDIQCDIDDMSHWDDLSCMFALPKTPPPIPVPEPTSIVLPGGATITEKSCADHLPITGRNFFKEEVEKLLGRTHV